MIQFETVKYGILKKTKDNQRASKGDSTSSCSEEDVLLAETNSSTYEQCHNTFSGASGLSISRQRKSDVKMDSNDIEAEGVTDRTNDKIDENMEEKRSKHNEDEANNNGNNENDVDGVVDEEELEKTENQSEQGDGTFGPGYFSLEALQKMAQFVSAAMASSVDNEDAQKQLAVLQSTLFTLQHQQLFQMQLIQQLQSQLSINRTGKPNDEDEDEEDGEGDGDVENEREEGELTEEQMAEEQRKYEEEQRALKKEKEKQKDADKRDGDKEKTADQPLNSNGPQPLDSLSAMEASFSSSFASSIITNHDELSSMDGLNSLEMLQKRAEEVLDSASRGILSGSLTDEMSFKSDGKGRNEPYFKHRCRYCGKVFGSDSALQIHIRSHTGERPFKCNVCGSRFTTKGNLKVHFQRHTQKFPHIHMNPNPIPEHLDKFYPSLLPPLQPGQQPPISPPPPTTRPSAPPQINLPFPPIPGLPPGFPSLQNLPGLPFLRPPFDLLKQMSAHPFFGAAMHEATQQPDQETPADLSKPASSTSKAQIKEEPKEEEPLSPQVEKDLTEEPKSELTTNEKRRHCASPTTPTSWKDEKSDEMSPTRSIENYSPKNDQPENLSSKMLSKLSPSSMGSHRENHFHENQNDIKMFPKLLPRPGSNDNSWESFIEVDKSSETSKLQQFVENIESKITEPNECGVCHKVLSCHSALIMHYRTHTGIRPFKCLICGRKFTTKGNLKTHMSVHRMKPPMRTVHQCPVCHKKYSNALVLQQHIRLHTGEPTDLTLEQISAAEITGMSSSSFPLGLNPFAFPIPGLHQNASGTLTAPESSNGDNDEFMDEDFEEESNFEDQISNTGSVSGDSNQNISRVHSDEHTQSRINAMLNEHSKSLENLSRAPSAASHTESAEGKRSTSPRTPSQVSPSPSDMSQGALDLTPRSDAKPPVHTSLSSVAAAAATANLAGFPNFPFMPHGVNTSSPMMTNALNSLAQSVAPMGPFNPMALSGVRGNTTCKICFKTFACQSALEIHYRSHTKERPYKCSICDKAFTTKGNMKQHMMTHKLRDMPQHMFNSNTMESSSNAASPDHPKESAPTSIRVKSEAELSPRSTENSRSSMSSQDRSIRERSIPPQFPTPGDTNYQLILERQQQLQMQQQQLHRQLGHDQSTPTSMHFQGLTQPLALIQPQNQLQHIKNDARKSSSSGDAEEPSAKRQLLSDSHNQDIPTSLKDAYHMPPQHPEEKTASHLERLQQFHSSSLLSQPIKMEPSHLKGTATSPGSGDAAGDQKHFCHLCQKNFSSTSSLQIHMRTHTGERPFVCNVCQKAFTTKGNLKVHMGIHTWSGASRRGRRMSLELPFNGSMPLMLQSSDFLQRHSDFFHPYPPAHLLGRMQQSMSLEHQPKLDRGAPLPASQIMNLANKYMNANGFASHNHIDGGRQSFSSATPSPVSDKQISPNSIRDEIAESPKRNGNHSPMRSGSTDLSPRMWKLHYESKAVNRENSKNDEQTKSMEELIA